MDSLKKSDWTDFFKVNGEFAIRNLTVLITIIISSFIVTLLAFERDENGRTQLSGDIFAAYLLAGAGVYSFGKWQDEKSRRSQIDSGTQPAQIVNTTTINQPGVSNVASPPS